MTFEEILALVSKMENGETMVEGIKKRLSDVNKSEKNQRTRRKETETKLETLTSDFEAIKNQKNPVLEELSGLGLNFENGDDVKEVVTKFVKSSTDQKDFDITKQSEYIKLSKELKRLSEKDAQSEKEKAELKLKSNRKEIVNTLLNGFNDNIMNGSKVLELMVNDPNSTFLIDDKERVGFKLDDGEIITGSEAIINKYKELHPKEVLNKQNSGGNSQQTQNQNYSPPTQFTDISQVKNLSADQIADMEKNNPKQYAQMMQVVAEQS
jgi:hypothetical protein